MLALGLALLATLPPTIPDPRFGPSSWAVVELRPGLEPSPASGYLVVVPEAVDEAWLGRLVDLASRSPVVGLGVPAGGVVVQYLDGVVVASREEAEAVRGCCPGTALVGAAASPAEALEKLAWGVTSLLVPGQPVWADAVEGAFADPQPARGGGVLLARAGRSSDLAVLVGIPPGFPGGLVELPTAWVASPAELLVGEEKQSLAVEVAGEAARVHLPPLPDGALLVVPRPMPPGGVERVEVTARRELSLGEVLARHHRQVALQKRVVRGFSAWQRLVLRVRVAELDRSFELQLEGPAYDAPDAGRVWELQRARVDGAPWPVDELPELPLVQPKAPPVPPLALELAPSYRYRLIGLSQWEGRQVYVLGFSQEREGERRWGRAYLDAGTFGLVAQEAWQETPRQEVRRSRTVTRNRYWELDGAPLWLPWQVEGDDTAASFGSVATLHRELTLEDLKVNDPAVFARRAEAWQGSRPMLRERRGEVVFLEPDGRGGRREASGGRTQQSFLLGGAFWDRSLEFPLPLAGYQLLDFRFHEDQQLRLFFAGAVNDLAWSRPGAWEVKASAFLQLAPFTESLWRKDEARKGEELYLWRQKLRVGLARQVGSFRLAAEAGVDLLHFSRTSNTSPAFRLPVSTPEASLHLQATWHRGELLAGVQWERGERRTWRRWGFGEPVEPRFSRGGVFARYERNLGPLVKVGVAADLATSRHTDRFSRFSLGGFGGGFFGVPGGRVKADELATLSASLALPAGRQGLELAAHAGWVGNRELAQRAVPVAAAGATVTRRGPWGTVLQASIGWPLVVPGPNAPAVQVVMLRPWR